MANLEEQQYLDLMKRVLEQGSIRKDRTGTGVKSIFGATMHFSLRDQFVLLTSKKIFLRGIFEELKLFLVGNTNSKILEEKKVNIWKGNTSREALDKLGLTYLPEGEMGCSYPHQWRNFGGEHPLIPETKGHKGVDQIQNIIDKIKNNPTDRRIYLIGSNPAQEHLMALPPCHNYAQFYCDLDKKELHCFLVIRSNDLFLGCPFNLSQYALLTILLAKITGYSPGELLYTGVDVHLYADHLDQAAEQIKREPRPFPKLFLRKNITSLADIETLIYEDLEVTGYDPHPPIKAKMSA
jgi:thymidylate synthase